MKNTIRIIGAIIIGFILMNSVCYADSNTQIRYATQKVSLRDKAKGKVICKVKRNTKLTICKTGRVWTRVQYKGEEYAVKKKYLSKSKSPKVYTAAEFRRAGVIHWKGATFTWYSQRVLPGGGLKIPGRHVDANGFICDKDNYIVFASTIPMKLKNKIVPTPFGKYGKCYDCGAGSNKWRDIYVAW